jgi:apolipoprotein N-acyltransferase
LTLGPVIGDRIGSLSRPQLRLLLLGSGCLSGALFWASIPKLEIHLLAWICLLPCLSLLPYLSPQRLFSLGMVGGLTAGLGRTYWITETLQLYGNLNLLEALTTNFLLILYLALYWAVFFFLCSRFRLSSCLFPWLAASLWVLLEWAQNWVITGFPWQLLGYSQYRQLALLQLTSVTGIYGISFLIALVNGTFAHLLSNRLTPSRLLIALSPPVLLLAATLLLGQQRLDTLAGEETSDVLEVGIVQGNISQDLKWKTSRVAGTTNHYIELTRTLPAGQLDLIIFPETALPFYFQHPYYAQFQRQIADLAKEMATPILVGSLGGSWEEGIYNRTFLVDAEGAVLDYADKVHLVPFGEYLPLAFIFQYLEALTAESGAFVHGESHKALTLPDSDQRAGIFICYESIFPEITRQLALLGSSFLVNTTNDAWFGVTAAPYQHFAMVAVRAAETGLPVLRAANTGISGLIGPSGRILRATDLLETTAFTVRLHPRREITFFVRHGNLLIVFCALLLAGYFTWEHPWVKSRRREKGTILDEK